MKIKKWSYYLLWLLVIANYAADIKAFLYFKWSIGVTDEVVIQLQQVVQYLIEIAASGGGVVL